MTIKTKKILVCLFVGGELSLALVSAAYKVYQAFHPERVEAFEHWGAKALSFPELYEDHGMLPEEGGNSAWQVATHMSTTRPMHHAAGGNVVVHEQVSMRMNSQPMTLYTTSSAQMQWVGGGGDQSLPGGQTSSHGATPTAGQVSFPVLSYVEPTYAMQVEQIEAEQASALTGQRRAPGMNGGSVADSWVNWLSTYGSSYASSSDGTNIFFTDSDLQRAYNAWLMSGYISPDMPVPTFEEWLSWIKSSDNTTIIRWLERVAAPIGDGVGVLLLLAMAMLGFEIVRKHKKEIEI